MNVVEEIYSSEGHFYKVQTKECIHCNESGYIDVQAQGLFFYNQGKLIQECFPEMSVGLREQLITGTHPECFKEMFAEIEEE